MFNLQVFPIHLAAGVEQADLPGLLAVSSPRRPARNRAGDQLVIYLTFEGKVQLTQAQLDELLQKLSGIFYRTPGSVTAAMRAMAASLNEFLLSRNLKMTREDGQIAAIMNLAVLHGEVIYLAHCGPTISYLFGQGGDQFFNDMYNLRGLGLSRSVPIRFYQAQVQPGSLVLFTTRPPAHWSPEQLAGSDQLTTDALRRRLVAPVLGDLRAVALRLQPGKGEIILTSFPKDLTSAVASESSLQAAPSLPSVDEAAQEPVIAQPIPAAELQPVMPEVVQPEASPAETSTTASETAGSQSPSRARARDRHSGNSLVERLVGLGRTRRQDQKTSQAAPPAPVRGQYISRTRPEARKSTESDSAAEPVVSAESTQFPVIQPELPIFPDRKPLTRPAVSTSPKPKQANSATRLVIPTRLQTTMADAVRRGDSFQKRMGLFTRKAVARITPVAAHESPKLSPATMIFLAVAIPLVIAAIAATVYVRNGYGEQHQAYLGQAQTFVNLAAEQPDPILKKNSLTQALSWLDQAETYGQSDESIALRNQVQGAIDSLEGIRRLNFVPAAPTMFDPQINVIRMVVAPNEDLYVLDGNSGRILRMIYTRPGYEIDPDFHCGPGKANAENIEINPFIDLIAVSPNNPDGVTVMGIDNDGKQTYCGPGVTAKGLAILSPDAGWQNPVDITASEDVLYVLDTQNAGVYRIPGDGVTYSSAPRLFFDQQVPPLTDAISLAVYQDDLFLLYSDGRMARCKYSAFEDFPTTCEVELRYNLQPDGSGGEGLLVLDRPVVQMQTTTSPAYSLFLFSPDGPTIYHFSLALNLQYTYRPALDSQNTLPDRAATSFLVTPTRRVVMAFGNQVYYSELP